MNLLLITILEIIYVLYTFIFMKTSLYFLHPIEIFKYFEKSNFNFFKHSVQKGMRVNRICPFGKVMIIILCIYLIIRYSLYKNNYKLRKINITILILTFMLSFLNMNSFVYLIPYFIIELIVSKYFN